MATKNASDSGIYSVVGDSSGCAYMKSDPYADKNTWSKAIKRGTKLTVDYSVTNYWSKAPGGENENHTWYHTSYTEKGTKYSGFVFSGDVTRSGDLPASIRFTGNFTQPYDYTENRGQIINLTSGLIEAESGSIKSVQAYFFRSGSDPTNSANWLLPTKKVAVNKNSYQITRSSAINKQLTFGDLTAGTYKYGIAAIDNNGKAWYWESNPFTISPKAQPVVKNCDLQFGSAVAVDGGVRATISSSTPGAAVTVTPADRIVWSNGSSVTVELTSTTTVNATASANGYRAASGSRVYNVGYCLAPNLNINETPDGTVVTLTSLTNGASIYYSLDDSNYTAYRSPLTLTASQTVYAYAKKAGCAQSEKIWQTILVTAPFAPVISSGALGSDVAVGTEIAVSWQPVRNASSYEVTITSADGSVTTQTVTQSQASVTAGEEGAYEFQVRAKNAIGVSDASNTVRVTAHGPATVQFINYDGTLLAEQTVKWGESAVAPSVPARRGYTFSGWDRPLKNVTGDLIVTAQYEIKTYTVRFFDYDGETPVDTQRIRFEGGIDSDAARRSLTEKIGHVFTGWRVVSADEESEMNPQCVDSNMSLVAVRKWENAELPVIISNVQALRDRDAKSYEVTYDITTAPREQLGGDTTGVKVVAVLKSNQTSESGEPIHRVIALAVDTVMLTEDTQQLTGKSITVTLGNQGNYTKADVVEVYALALDGADRTGGALSEVATGTPQITTTWSDWSDTEPSGVGADNIRTRTVYRYCDNSKLTTVTTTRAQPQTSLNGWQYERSSDYWSGDFTSYDVLGGDTVRKIGEESVKQTEAYTQYRYGRWTNGNKNNFCPDNGKNIYGGNWWIENTAWMTTPYRIVLNDAGTKNRVFYCSNWSTHKNHFYYAFTDSDFNWYTYSQNGSYSQATRWFWEETQTVPATYRTRYTYQYKYYTNYFYKWIPGIWSGWSTEPVSATESRDVETKTQYSYITNDTSQTPDASGQEYTLNVSAPLSGDLEGKLATVLVYRTRNTDPTEAQLEYVDQVTLGENASFTLTLKNKEDPCERTGDYTVALAVQGGGNLINVAQIRYDAEYTVTFTDGEGNQIGETQTVRRGESAKAPEQPVKDGYRFVKWDGKLTDVQSNMELPAVWMPETWSVVFVDHVNQTVEMQNNLETGTLLPLPEAAPKEGYEFEGWSVRRSSDNSEVDAAEAITVDANLIVVANWKQKTYTVSFMDADGSVIETQQVAYGDAAMPPESIDTGNDTVFIGWSSEFSWWSVTENINVSPIIAFKETTSAPSSNLDSYVSGIQKLLELTAEDGAKIYYTTDGSDPTVAGSKDNEVFEYTDPIELTEDTTILVFATSDGKNASEVIEIDFVYQETAEEDPHGQVINLQTINAIVEPSQLVELRVNLQNNPGLLSYQFVLQADPSVFGVPCDEDGNMLLAQSLGDTGDNLFVTPYDPELGGWMVFWFSTETYRENGPLLSLSLKTFDEVPADAYPIKLGYIAENTVTEDYVQAPIESDSLQLAIGTGARLGDVSGDGLVTAVDVIRIAKYLVKDYAFTAPQLVAADVTGDGKITAADVIRLARYIVGLAELGA